MYDDRDTEMCRGEGTAAKKPEKPSHVRKLNFGQSILTLDGVRQFQGQKDGALVISSNVTGIPSTSKVDFVRKWLETHSNHGSNSKETPCLSPVLGLSMSQPVETSPVFGNKCKRTREKAGLRVMIDEGECWRSDENSFNTSKSNKRIKVDSSSRKENVKKKLFDSPSATVFSKAELVTASPVLLRKSYCYKRRRRKSREENSRRKVLECIKNKYAEAGTVSPVIGLTISTPKRSPVLDKNRYLRSKRQKMQKRRILDNTENRCVDSNMNSMLSCDLLHSIPTTENILSTQKQNMLIKKLENICENDDINCSASEESEVAEESVKLRSPVSKGKLNIENSPKDCEKDLGEIEIESSNEENSSPNDVIRINNDSDPNFSDHIEDVDSQDVDLLARKKNLASNKLKSDVSERVPSRSQSPNKDSDRTFFSEAEQVRSFPSVQSSQRISQISSQAIDNHHNRSSQTGIIISTASTPPKATEGSVMQLTDLDSTKKRRKPKRGSLVEKLQSAINRQVSFIRMWKHQLKQAVKDNEPAQCATIFVRGCTVRFGRQFLDGIVVEDPFNLLPRKEGGSCIKFVKMMLIPDIVGRVELNSGGLVQIFPPWETLDDDDFVLNITYIRVVENEKDVEQYERNASPIKRSIVKDFDCPCIELNRSVPSCKNRLGKPNVIEKLVTGA